MLNFIKPNPNKNHKMDELFCLVNPMTYSKLNGKFGILLEQELCAFKVEIGADDYIGYIVRGGKYYGAYNLKSIIDNNDDI